MAQRNVRTRLAALRVAACCLAVLPGAGCTATTSGNAGNRAASVPAPAPEIAVVHRISDPDRPVRRPRGPYRGPIIDTHTHLVRQGGDGAGVDVAAEMRAARVAGLIVLPTPNEGRFPDADENAAGRRSLAGRSGGRILRACGSTYLTVWMDDAYRGGWSAADLRGRLARLDRDLTDGGCAEIGEIGPHHFEKVPGQKVIDFPLGFAPLMKLAGLAAARGAWLDLHAEPRTPDGASREDEVFGGIGALFARHPALKLILSHTGMTNAANARALLRRYPNLTMNFKLVRTGKSRSWDNLEPILNARRLIFRDWAALMEDMPTRFMVGTDWRFGDKGYDAKRYVRLIHLVRRLLGSLSPGAARLIAHGNAERLWPAFRRGQRAPRRPLRSRLPWPGTGR